MLAMGIWALWKKINDKLWDGVLKPVSVSLQIASDQLHAWEIARKFPWYLNNTQQASSSDEFVWKKPDPGMLKCNVDVAIFDSENKYGVSMCIRD